MEIDWITSIPHIQMKNYNVGLDLRNNYFTEVLLSN